MDFTPRTSAPQPASSAQYSSPTTSSAKKASKKPANKWLRWGTGLLGLALVVLVAAVILIISLGGPKSEDSYVDSNRLQAVFLNTGQVYFGNVTSLNDKYFVLDHIYYLQTSSSSSSSKASTASTNVSLVKLGCELHSPYDQMVINRDQVTFWENLQPSGQVAKAVATFQKDNPTGQKCTDQSQSNTSTSTGVQGSSSTNSSSSTTPSTTTKP